MSTARDRALIVKVARMYYEQNMSQDQIARALLTSRSNVSRILSVAKKRGIVEIKINEATKRETDIEEMLISRFGLDAAMVAKVPRSTSDYKAVGQLAIQSFLSHLKPRVKVAISWGRSIQAMVDALEPEKRPDLTFIPLMGGMTAIPSSYSGDALIQSLAEKYSAQYQVLHAPTIVQSPDIKDRFDARAIRRRSDRLGQDRRCRICWHWLQGSSQLTAHLAISRHHPRGEPRLL